MASLTYMARFGLPIVAVVWAANVRLLPLRAHSWPCLSMSAPGVCLKGVSHYCGLDIGSLGESLACTWRISPPDACRTRTYHWTWRPNFRSTCYSVLATGRFGAAGWEAPTATVSACHVMLPRPRRYSGACNVTVGVMKVQLSVSKGRLQRHLMDDICSTRKCPRVEHESRADFSNGKSRSNCPWLRWSTCCFHVEGVHPNDDF